MRTLFEMTKKKTHRLAQNWKRLDFQLKLLPDGRQMHQSCLCVSEECGNGTKVSLKKRGPKSTELINKAPW